MVRNTEGYDHDKGKKVMGWKAPWEGQNWRVQNRYKIPWTLLPTVYFLVNESTGERLLARGKNAPAECMSEEKIRELQNKGDWEDHCDFWYFRKYAKDDGLQVVIHNAGFKDYVLDLAAGLGDDGTTIYSYEENGGNNQYWKVQIVDEQY
ncbi:hypothetical protein BT69DRAFT_1286036 [Atractiella rhizophila]|nr:hypothetical protein BT69DRAFT_1286036 [Atractiella rhizophila]